MKRVLVLVDYQKDFVDGALGFEDAVKLDEGLSKKVAEFLNDPNGIVIATLDSHRKSYLKTLEGRKLPVEHCIIGSEGHNWYGKTREIIEASYEKYEEYIGSYDRCASKTDKGNLYIVTKNTFGSMEMGDLLMQLNSDFGLEQIDICGIVTNMCVISAAVISKTACPDVEVNIIKDLVASFDNELHQKALDVMAGLQMNIV